MTTLRKFLNDRRTTSDPYNLVGWGNDLGKYNVAEDEYDDFLGLLHKHIFGQSPQASNLLERHRDNGPLLVDLDMRYETGGPLVRRFNNDNVQNFIAMYTAAMIYFSKVESLPVDLVFYHLEKPSPEKDKDQHKDGVHIQCPNITTTPKYQFALRGFLLTKGIIQQTFGATKLINPPEDCYDEAVIHRNAWFLYGACKPDKPQYRVVKMWKICIADVIESLEGKDPADFDDLIGIVNEIMSEEMIPTDSLGLMKTLSIRRSHHEATPLAIRTLRQAEWDGLLAMWGAGKKRSERPLPVIQHVSGGDEKNLMIVDSEESRRVTSKATKKDIALAFRLCYECINASKRAGDYHEWVRMAILLKNIAGRDSEDAFKVWCDISRRATQEVKKPDATDVELEKKWKELRVDSSQRIGMGSLWHWAEKDNPLQYKIIMSETISRWINAFATDTHVSVASCVQEIFRQQFRCSVGQRKGSYEWYQYIEDIHSWKHMHTNTELRAHLSGRVKAEYAFAVGNSFIESGKAALKKDEKGEDDQQEIERTAADDKRKKLQGIVRQLEMTTFKDHVMKECQEKFYDEEFLSKLDSVTDTLGVANGVLDLRYTDSENSRPYVRFREGMPDDNISFQMGRMDGNDSICYYPYDPNSQEQKDIMAFFERIYPDPVLRKYVLTLLASCLEGANKEQKFYVMQGKGSNGKSMIEMLMELTFGDYGTSISTAIFTRSKPDSGSANPDIITTKHRRFIHCGEPDDNQKVNTSIMKQWTGGDLIQARGLFSEQDKFRIVGKIFMSCNDLPPISKMDNGTWRRIRVIPHDSTFKDPGDPLIDPSKHIYPKDLNLEAKLRKWRTSFLSLLVHYYDTEYLVNGLVEPDCVMAASNKYKEASDLFMAFFSANFVREVAAGPVMAKEVKNAFRDWMREQPKNCDLKISSVMERMKEVCGLGSTDKEFWGIKPIEEDAQDISGAQFIGHMP